jgi:hypothetical protein
MNSNTHKTAQGQEHEANGHFSVDDAVFLVDTEGDAHAARKYFGTAIEFELFWQMIKTWDNVPLLVVSTRNAYGYTEWLIKRYGPAINVRFVDLEGKTLEAMAKRQSSWLRLCRLIENPWHMTMTSGRC